jgi:pimeloyl-ACP methyl ester carboxylesterase
MHFATLGSGPRVVLVHGSVVGAATWDPVRPLADRYALVLATRPGFGEGEPVERVDFERDAALLAGSLEPGDHLVGHSYGGVVSLLAAARRDDLRSLAVVEPPAFGLTPAAPGLDAVRRHYADGPADPRAHLAGFLELVGSPGRLPDPLPPALERGARLLQVERGPWEARIPLDALAATPYPKLAVSGGHSALFDGVVDVLVARLGAARAVLPGAGHNVPRAPGFVERLGDFLDRAEPGA